MSHVTIPEAAEKMIQNLRDAAMRQDGSGHPLRAEAELRGLIAGLYQDMRSGWSRASQEGAAHQATLKKLEAVEKERDLVARASMDAAQDMALAMGRIAEYNRNLRTASLKLIRTLGKACEVVMPRLRGSRLVNRRMERLGKLACNLCGGSGKIDDEIVLGKTAEECMKPCPDCSPLLAATPRAAEVKKTPTTLGFVDAAPITLRQFQVLNERRVPAFGATLEGQSLREWCCELAEEAGEVCGVAKKLARASHPTDPKKDITGKPRKTMSDLADEIGDVVTVAAIVASRAGIDFEQAVKVKWNKVSEGVNWRERL